MIAVQKAGMVSTGLSPLLTPSELTYQLNNSGTKLVMTLDVFFDKIGEVADKAAFLTVVVTEIADFMLGIKRVLGKGEDIGSSIGECCALQSPEGDHVHG
jgi:long-chain acyl-CoA synthetase